MIVNLKRCLSILLVMMLLIGIIPAAYAVESGADSTQREKTVSEGTDSIDPTEPTEPTEPPDIANPQDDYAVMSVGSTQKSILLFDYADNGNYTTVLKSQVSCEYKPNGTGAARTAYIKNLGWHFARYGGVAYPDEPLYCIEPWRNYGASTSGNSVDRGVTLDGSGSTAGSNVWYAMPEDYREAIGLILLYGTKYCHQSPTMDEEPLQQAIMAAINSVMDSKGAICSKITEAAVEETGILPDSAMILGEINRRLEELETEFNILLQQPDSAVKNAARFGGIANEIASLKGQREIIAARLRKDQTVQLHVHTMEAALDGMSHLMQQWDEEMIRQLVHTVKVISADHIKVFLCNGIEIDQTVNP